MDVKVMQVKMLAVTLAAFIVATWFDICIGSQSQLLEPGIDFLAADFDSNLEICCCPAIFSFGSSVADTGTGVLVRVDSPASNYPYGITYPGHTSGRWSDGRLLIDFWAKKLGLPYLDPFIRSGTSSFRGGVNFASAGSTAAEKFSSSLPWSFNLAVQLHQFRIFKSQVLGAHQDRDLDVESYRPPMSGCSEVRYCPSSLPRRSVFQDALYIVAAGANDIMFLSQRYTSIEEMRAAIPDISAAIMRVVEELYQEGARKILVEDVYPLACMPIISGVKYTVYGEMGALDSDGCVKHIDDLVLMHNTLLKKEIVAFAQSHSSDLSIALVDTYSIRRDLMTHPVKYGFKYGFAPCCGIGGIPKSFKSDEKCGQSPRARPCTYPPEYVVWDGLHYTEAANIATMSAILSGEHFYPKFYLNCTK